MHARLSLKNPMSISPTKYVRIVFKACLGLALCFSFGPLVHANTASDRVGFTISFNGLTSDFNTLMTTVMPSGKVTVKTTAKMVSQAGRLRQTQSGWEWTAPETPGRYEIRFEKDGEESLLNIFVLTPFKNGTETSLSGYKIGTYRKTLFRGLKSYTAPKGFIDLSHGPSDLKVSPNFTLGQFICKQQPGHDPTYLLLRPETLIKLETLLEAARQKGWSADTLHIMSGFRTPFYNRSIGNRTTSSRHLYGGAADIWLDGDGDGRMDDLNEDGKINKDDARALAKLAESLSTKGGANWPSGGLGIYAANSVRGPFIHIDSRGYMARWGQ